ncbi:hypothetical protein C1H46_021483 [Malus baccata]|uniref:Uncharacterized protein n=1 Tax=Malus baccata TaxID=106549 RepID=A0A540M2M8_MALBA|nr:hypothetical protein C1H46_021483 [Malus baccata]
MNEYCVPELNVQNGVLKSLSFLFQYIGEMGKDYIYAVTPLLEDALMEAIEGMKVALGAALRGLFHPARKVKEVYGKIYNRCISELKMLSSRRTHCSRLRSIMYIPGPS